MKILHCCLANFYIDNFSYQENILPKMHKLQGHDVRIIASTETYNTKLKLDYISPSTYLNENGILVTRLPYIKGLSHSVIKKLRIYKGLNKQLYSFKPDIIFLHDCQFLSINTIVRYAKKNNVHIYVDSHTDFINSAKSWLSRNILHKIIYRYCAKRIEKYTTKFYGTLPVRCDFLHDVYHIRKNKIELLPFGVDDSLFNYENKTQYKNEVRQNLNISLGSSVIITGGKIDERKKIHILLNAFTDFINENEATNVHLIVFGKPTEEMKDYINKFLNHNYIHYLEWIDSKEIYKYFFASDVAFFPGTHSVLWEEVVGLGVPAIFYSWEGIQHLDKGGNCLYIKSNDYENIKNTLCRVVGNPEKIRKMKEIANEVGPKYFSYSNIAKKAIEID